MALPIARLIAAVKPLPATWNGCSGVVVMVSTTLRGPTSSVVTLCTFVEMTRLNSVLLVSGSRVATQSIEHIRICSTVIETTGYWGARSNLCSRYFIMSVRSQILA
jgi:hypothetical protein